MFGIALTRPLLTVQLTSGVEWDVFSLHAYVWAKSGHFEQLL